MSAARAAGALAAALMLAGGGVLAQDALLRPFPWWEAWLLGESAPLLAEPGELLAWPEDSRGAQPGETWTFPLRLEGAFDLLLRERRPSSLQDYRRSQARLAVTAERGGWWLGLRGRRARSVPTQDDIYTDDDRLRGGLDADGMRLALGARIGDWAGELATGRGRGWEGAAALVWRRPWGRLHAFAERATGRWLLDQSFEARRYRFSFPFTRTLLRGGFAPASPRLPALGALREVTAGTPATASGDYNDFQVVRHAVELRWPGRGVAFLSASAAWGDLETAMFADATAYQRLRDGRFRTLRARALGPALWRRGRLALHPALDAEETRVSARRGFFEPWPFVFWEVFANDHYALAGLDYKLRSAGPGLELRRGAPPEEAAARGTARGLPARAGDGDAARGTTRGTSWMLGLRHLWLDGGGGVDWTERYLILWPVVYGTEPHHGELPLPALQMLRLDFTLAVELGEGWRLRGWLTQFAPLRTAEAGGAGGGGGGGGGPSLGGDDYSIGGFSAGFGVER